MIPTTLYFDIAHNNLKKQNIRAPHHINYCKNKQLNPGKHNQLICANPQATAVKSTAESSPQAICGRQHLSTVDATSQSQDGDLISCI
jgi:hypothetical protein